MATWNFQVQNWMGHRLKISDKSRHYGDDDPPRWLAEILHSKLESVVIMVIEFPDHDPRNPAGDLYSHAYAIKPGAQRQQTYIVGDHIIHVDLDLPRFNPDTMIWRPSDLHTYENPEVKPYGLGTAKDKNDPFPYYK